MENACSWTQILWIKIFRLLKIDILIASSLTFTDEFLLSKPKHRQDANTGLVVVYVLYSLSTQTASLQLQHVFLNVEFHPFKETWCRLERYSQPKYNNLEVVLSVTKKSGKFVSVCTNPRFNSVTIPWTAVTLCSSITHYHTVFSLVEIRYSSDLLLLLMSSLLQSNRLLLASVITYWLEEDSAKPAFQ